MRLPSAEICLGVRLYERVHCGVNDNIWIGKPLYGSKVGTLDKMCGWVNFQEGVRRVVRLEVGVRGLQRDV